MNFARFICFTPSRLDFPNLQDGPLYYNVFPNSPPSVGFIPAQIIYINKECTPPSLFFRESDKMAPKKDVKEQKAEVRLPTNEIEQGIKAVEETTEDVLTQATKAVGTMMDLSKQASKIATSLGLGSTKEASTATSEITKEVGVATSTLMNTSVDMVRAGSDAAKTTARIGVNALNTSINLGKDLLSIMTGVVLLTGEIVEATGEIFEVSGRMIKTFGKLVSSTGKIFK